MDQMYVRSALTCLNVGQMTCPNNVVGGAWAGPVIVGALPSTYAGQGWRVEALREPALPMFKSSPSRLRTGQSRPKARKNKTDLRNSPDR